MTHYSNGLCPDCSAYVGYSASCRVIRECANCRVEFNISRGKRGAWCSGKCWAFDTKLDWNRRFSKSIKPRKKDWEAFCIWYYGSFTGDPIW